MTSPAPAQVRVGHTPDTASLIDSLRYRPVGTTAAQMHAAADLLEAGERLRLACVALNGLEGADTHITQLEPDERAVVQEFRDALAAARAALASATPKAVRA
jgi:hypothetical protein